ncbi:type IV secretion system protein [Variovorax sp.]|uniref:type IV secretion system protein n=1 Tax=Variovorax sp. TaxID=1871043 RepID=UPI003BA92436
MFFRQLWTQLVSQLTEFIGAKSAALASAVEPAVITLATLYVMIWGYLSLTGKIQEPILEGIKRIFFIAVILGVALRLWAFNELIVDTFFNAPTQLAAAIVGATDPVSTIDTIWEKGGEVAFSLWSRGGVLNGDVGFYIAGAVIYLIIGAVAVYALFLFALSKIALSVVLALGPIFISLLFFEATRRFFEAWVAQLSNYALVAVLASMVASLMLQVVANYAAQTAERGAALTTVDAINMALIAAVVLLVMCQVMPIAAGLASGVALSSFSAVGGLTKWALGGTRRSAYEFGRGVLDGLHGERGSRWDSFRRLGGNRVGSSIASLAGRGASAQRPSLPRDRVMNPSSSRT